MKFGLNRYFLYLIFLNMLVNIVMFVPKLLIQYRFDGAVMGIILAIPISIILTILLCKAFSVFPSQGLPEILDGTVHPRIKVLLLGVTQLFWFSAGLFSLLTITDIIIRFLNPESPKWLVISIYLVAVCFIMLMPTKRVMYYLEIVLFLNTPLILFILFKVLSSNYISWDAILEVGTYVFNPPNFKTIATATFTFSGYTNLFIFNRVIHSKIKASNIGAISILGALNLFTSFLMPIGMFGADGTHELLYPWIITSDSVRLVYSPIERALFLLIMLYMSISLISASIHWHVSLELIKGMFKNQMSIKSKWIVLALFVTITIIGAYTLDTLKLIKITSYWLIFRFFSEVVIIILFFVWSKWRSDNQSKQSQKPTIKI